MRRTTERIEPADASLLTLKHEQGRDKLMRAAVQANVRQSVEQPRSGSDLLEDLVARGHPPK